MIVGVLSHLFPTLRRPGFGIFIKDELDCLAEKIDLKLIAPLHNQFRFEPGAKQYPQCDYPVIRPFVLAFPRWFMQRHYPDSMAITLRMNKEFFKDVRLIHAHNAFPEGVAAVKVYGGKLPVVVTVHGSDINVFGMKPNLRPDIVNSLNQASAIISVSGALKNKLQNIGVKTRVEVVPNGLNTRIFTPGSREDACLRLALDPEKQRIIFIGNFTWIKGVEYLIRAFHDILEKKPNCELLLVGARPGSGDFLKYKREIDNIHPEESVKIIPQVPHHELPFWIRASDVLSLPSIKEGFGLVAAEALSCGIPVVSTYSGGPEDIVREGMGYLVPAEDSIALGSALIKTLNREGILQNQEISSYAHERFSFDNIAGKIIDIYNSVI